MATTRSAEVRASLSHPVVDADGHFVELTPVMNDEILTYLEEVGGPVLRDRYARSAAKPTDTTTVLANRTLEGARDTWRAMPSWWGWRTRNTLDRATSHLPELLYQRLDDMGIDYTLLYPSMTLSFLDLMDEELAPPLCRAANRWMVRQFAPYSDRCTVGALIPMLTPDIAIGELEYAVTELGCKTVVIAGYARRPIPYFEREFGRTSPAITRWDTYGIDSEYDYDPFWRRCVELGVAPISHSAKQYHRIERSVSNYVYNHIGGLGSCHEALAKSLFLGGVTHRFPSLRFGFLEGGVAWACSLYADLLGHWEKRNITQIHELDPSALDVEEMMAHVEEYGTDEMRAARDRIEAYFRTPGAAPAELDDFAAAHIRTATDLRDKFVPNFYFGCEADDPLVAWAFNDKVNPHGARLRAIIGSDISHWDVVDMTEPVEEAAELVDKGLITPDDFREFAFLNPLRLHAGMNPHFFDGTVVEAAAAAAVADGLD